MATTAPIRNQIGIVTPFGATGSYTNHTFQEKFRTFSILNNSGTLHLQMPAGNTMIIPVGVTVNWDAGTQSNKLNKLKGGTFTILTASDCVVVATI